MILKLIWCIPISSPIQDIDSYSPENLLNINIHSYTSHPFSVISNIVSYIRLLLSSFTKEESKAWGLFNDLPTLLLSLTLQTVLHTAAWVTSIYMMHLLKSLLAFDHCINSLMWPLGPTMVCAPVPLSSLIFYLCTVKIILILAYESS